MLTLKELRLKAIGPFVLEQVVNFEMLGTLIQLDAENRNTGGSSGSGKSTFANAHDYLLGLNDTPNSVLQSRLTKDGISVIGTYDFDGTSLILERTKGKLRVELDGQVIEGSNKLAEEKLDEIIGMPRELFRLICHKRQKEGGFFLNYTPKQMHEFFTDALSLRHEQTKVETLDLKIKELEGIKLNLEIAVKTVSAGLESTMDALSAIGEAPAKSVTQEQILELKIYADSAVVALIKAQEENKIEANSLDSNRPILKQDKFDNSQLETVKFLRSSATAKYRELTQVASEKADEINALKSAAQSLLHKVSARDRASLDAKEKADFIRKIRESVCPCCNQTWLNEASKAKDAQVVGELLALRAVIATANQHEQECKELLSLIDQKTNSLINFKTHEIATIEARINELTLQEQAERTLESEFGMAQNHINRALLQDHSDRQHALAKKHSASLERVQKEEMKARQALDYAIYQMKHYENERAQYEKVRANLVDSEINKKKELGIHKEALESLARKLTLAQEAKRAVKSFMSTSYDDALEAIGESATTIIRSIPNMANATIQLQGVRETKEGKIKEEVTAVVNMNGEEAIPIKSLSGGERSSTDLAVDLAVIEFLEMKTNKGINIFILDEPFTGLDTVCIEMALERLKTCSPNKKIILVDHNPEVKEMVESKLTVIRDGETSTIVQQ